MSKTKLSLYLIFLSTLAFAKSVSAATEFTAIIDPGGSATSDFSSLSSWESTMTNTATDLTSGNTKVFSGTVTSSIANNTTVYQCRSGSYQSVSGTMVYDTLAGQALVKSITGGASFSVSDRWYTNNTCNSSGYFTISDTGDSAIAVAKCRTTTGNADTTAVTIDGWTTNATNYIKVWTDPNENYRHQGKWDEGKYRLEFESSGGGVIEILEQYTRIEGIQVYQAGTDAYNNSGIQVNFGQPNIRIQSSIIKTATVNNVMSGVGGAIYFGYQSSSAHTSSVWNNIIYNVGSGNYTEGICIYDYAGTFNIYNNTVYGFAYGIAHDSPGWIGTLILKNNLSYDNAYNYYGNEFDSSSTNNLSGPGSDADIPSTNARNGVTVSFASTTSGSEDFHLQTTDTGARNSGTNLYSDSNLPITSDIDGEGRSSTMAFDIGADETVQEIYRSVAPDADGSMSAIDDDNSQTDTLSITTAGAATFEVAVDDIVGVGDALVFDDDADNDLDANDTILFIHSRTDSTHFAVRTENGGWPAAATTDNDKWAIYRAYTSLFNAEAGTKNTAIPISFTGGNRDLVANNEQWNIACYANGTTADTAAVTIADWTTAPVNYLKVYTPVAITEVGTSQRHQGKWDDGKWRMEINASQDAIRIYEQFIWIDGLQVVVNTGLDVSGGIFNWNENPDNASYISNNIIRSASPIPAATSASAIGFWDYQNSYIWNNIIYGFTRVDDGEGYGIFIGYSNTSHIYNNSVVNNYIGIGGPWDMGNSVLINNLSYNNTDNYRDSAHASSTNNLSGPTQSDAPGSNPRNGQVVVFADVANNDFHLSPTDTGAKDAGAVLCADADLPVTHDIDGDQRVCADNKFDIGADETTGPPPSAGGGGVINLNRNVSLGRGVGLKGAPGGCDCYYYSGSGTDNFPSSGYASYNTGHTQFGSKITATARGTITSVGVKINSIYGNSMKIGLYYNNGGTWTLASNGCSTKASPGTGWQDVTLATPYIISEGQEILVLAAVNDDVYVAYNGSYEGHYTESGSGYNDMCSSTESYSAEANSAFGARIYVD